MAGTTKRLRVLLTILKDRPGHPTLLGLGVHAVSEYTVVLRLFTTSGACWTEIRDSPAVFYSISLILSLSPSGGNNWSGNSKTRLLGML